MYKVPGTQYLLNTWSEFYCVARTRSFSGLTKSCQWTNKTNQNNLFMCLLPPLPNGQWNRDCTWHTVAIQYVHSKNEPAWEAWELLWLNQPSFWWSPQAYSSPVAWLTVQPLLLVAGIDTAGIDLCHTLICLCRAQSWTPPPASCHLPGGIWGGTASLSLLMVCLPTPTSPCLSGPRL